MSESETKDDPNRSHIESVLGPGWEVEPLMDVPATTKDRPGEVEQGKTCPRCDVDGYWFKATKIAEQRAEAAEHRVEALEARLEKYEPKSVLPKSFMDALGKSATEPVGPNHID